jgi:hypothetical protein
VKCDCGCGHEAYIKRLVADAPPLPKELVAELRDVFWSGRRRREWAARQPGTRTDHNEGGNT